MSDEVAAFSDNRQRKMSESFKRANVNVRMVPALPNALPPELIGGEAPPDAQELSGAQEHAQDERGAPDYAALSEDAVAAIEAISGNVYLTTRERTRMVSILQPNNRLVSSPVLVVTALVVGSAAAGAVVMNLMHSRRP
jgi:hypothetical protein